MAGLAYHTVQYTYYVSITNITYPSAFKNELSSLL